MIDKRASLRRNTQHKRNVACTLTKAVRNYLLSESTKRVERDAYEIKVFLEM